MREGGRKMEKLLTPREEENVREGQIIQIEEERQIERKIYNRIKKEHKRENGEKERRNNREGDEGLREEKGVDRIGRVKIDINSNGKMMIELKKQDKYNAMNKI